MGISPTTAKNQFIEAMIKDGASLKACNMWFTLMTQSVTSIDHLDYVWRLVDLSKHLDCHPVNIITTCLSMGNYTKVDDEMMKCVWQMVSDDMGSQQETDEFWKDADGEIEIISKKDGDDESSGSYEEEPACEHDIVGDCEECVEREVVSKKYHSHKPARGVKRLIRHVVDDEAECVQTQA